MQFVRLLALLGRSAFTRAGDVYPGRAGRGPSGPLATLVGGHLPPTTRVPTLLGTPHPVPPLSTVMQQQAARCHRSTPWGWGLQKEVYRGVVRCGVGLGVHQDPVQGLAGSPDPSYRVLTGVNGVSRPLVQGADRGLTGSLDPLYTG